VTFEEYVSGRLPTLLRTATAICTDPHLAEELVQDVLVKLNRHWLRVAQQGSVDAYVRRMLVNEHVSWRRKWSRVVPTLDVPDRLLTDHASSVADRDALRRTVAGLPRRQQVALALRYFDDLSDTEIAQALGCAEGTVRSLISRALSTLRIELIESVTPATTPGGVR
jgi:RNA polymerase sigma-70 factor (sigma-E family)